MLAHALHIHVIAVVLISSRAESSEVLLVPFPGLRESARVAGTQSFGQGPRGILAGARHNGATSPPSRPKEGQD